MVRNKSFRVSGLDNSQRLAEDMFGGTFTTCLDKTFAKMDAEFKGYYDLTQAQGQICLTPGTKCRTKAFAQWVKDCYRFGKNPANYEFPVVDTEDLIHRYESHETFVKKSSTISDTAKPIHFSNKVCGEDWQPTLVNFLCSIPGRNGVPLSYIIRNDHEPNPTPLPDFLNDYVAMAPLESDAFITDAAEVHTYIVSFTSCNLTAEAKIQTSIFKCILSRSVPCIVYHQALMVLKST